jgi:hypothetical protein
VTAVNASGTLAAVDPVDAVVGPEAIAVDDDAVFGVGPAGLEPRPLGEHAARASVATRRNAAWSRCPVRLGGVIGITSRTIPRLSLLRKSCGGHPIGWSTPASSARETDPARSVVLVIADVIGELAVQRGLDQPRGQLREGPTPRRRAADLLSWLARAIVGGRGAG